MLSSLNREWWNSHSNKLSSLRDVAARKVGHGLTVAGMAALLPWAIAPEPASAAEQLALTYESFSFTIPVGDLEALAQEDAPVPQSFKAYASLATPGFIDSLRQGLNYRFSFDSVMLDQFLNAPVGEQLLRRLGNILKEDDALDRVTLLRQAFLEGATEESGLTLLSWLRAYPQETLNLDLRLVLDLVEENSRIYGQRSVVIKALWDAAMKKGQFQGKFPTALHQPGPTTWQKREIQFQNPSRKQRSKADLYLPAIASQASPSQSPGSTPSSKTTDVIVISHGLASNRETLAYFAEHFASYGFGVVVLEHVETSSERFNRFLTGQEGPPDPSELTSRPRDITAVLDYLTQQSKSDSTLQNLNLTEVGLLGQSLGGYTVLAASGATLNRPLLSQVCDQSLNELPSLNASFLIQCRLLELPADENWVVQDPRIKATIAINPLTSAILGPAGLSQVKVPTLMVASINDVFAPALPEQIEPFRWLAMDDKYLLVSSPATHFSFLTSGKDNSVLPIPPSFIGPKPELTFDLMEGVSLAFFKRHLQEKAQAEAYLSQDYVHSINAAPFEFGLFKELPSTFGNASTALRVSE